MDNSRSVLGRVDPGMSAADWSCRVVQTDTVMRAILCYDWSKAFRVLGKPSTTGAYNKFVELYFIDSIEVSDLIL